jgi:prophage regulatory protein
MQPKWEGVAMPRMPTDTSSDMLTRLATDPGHRTLGELLQERQWALGEIGRLRGEVVRLTSRQADMFVRARNAGTPPLRETNDPLASRRLLRLKDVTTLVGMCRSTIYRLIGEGRFPDRVHYGARAVRWRAADIFAWQNKSSDLEQRGGLDERAVEPKRK